MVKMGGFFECLRVKVLVFISAETNVRHRFIQAEKGAPSALDGFEKSQYFWP
jgi:hypothetical protein